MAALIALLSKKGIAFGSRDVRVKDQEYFGLSYIAFLFPDFVLNSLFRTGSFPPRRRHFSWLASFFVAQDVVTAVEEEGGIPSLSPPQVLLIPRFHDSCKGKGRKRKEEDTSATVCIKWKREKKGPFHRGEERNHADIGFWNVAEDFTAKSI